MHLALRQLAQSPGFTIVAVSIVALGIAAPLGRRTHLCVDRSLSTSARDYERLAITLAGMHWLTAVGLILAAINALETASA